MRRFFLLLCTVVLLSQAHAVSAQTWSRYRGPNGTGIVSAPNIPSKWTEADYNWKTKLPGQGHSSPVLWGDKIFLLSADDEPAVRYVLCLSAKDGKILWQRQYPAKLHKKHLLNTFASSTPAVDAERIYVSWSTPDEYTFLALTHDGRDAWRLNLGPYISQHSCGTSPMLYGDMVILCNEQDGEMKGENDGAGVSFLLAVSAKDGSQRWRIDRKSAVVTYSTPCVYPYKGQDVLLFNSQGHGISAVEPKSGKVLWETEVLNKRSVSSPVFYKDLVFATCGSGGGGNYVVAVRVGDKPEVAYKIEDSAPYVPTLLVKDDLLFMWSEKGIVSCAKAATGEVLWKERLGGKFWGSPICIDDRLYCTAEDGEVIVLAAKDKYELLAKNPLGEASSSTPAVVNGRLYLRSVSHLISLGK